MLPGWRDLQLRDFQGQRHSTCCTYYPLIDFYYCYLPTYLLFKPMYTLNTFCILWQNVHGFATCLVKKCLQMFNHVFPSSVCCCWFNFSIPAAGFSPSSLFFYHLLNHLQCRSHAFLFLSFPTLSHFLNSFSQLFSPPWFRLSSLCHFHQIFSQ